MQVPDAVSALMKTMHLIHIPDTSVIVPTESRLSYIPYGI